MSTRACAVLGFAAASLLLTTGCATTDSHCAIPTGAWRGEGWYVETGWTEENSKVSLERFERHTYKTTLDIRPDPDEGDNAVRISVQSIVGAREDREGDRNYVVAVLERCKEAASGDAALYRVVHWGYSGTEKTPKLDLKATQAYGPVCARDGRDLVLFLPYDTGFVDIYRFAGDRVIKEGSYATDAKAVIHWHEELKRE